MRFFALFSIHRGCSPVGYECGLSEVFVGFSFPQVPVMLLIFLLYFESPATTFSLVNHIRFAAYSGYDIFPVKR